MLFESTLSQDDQSALCKRARASVTACFAFHSQGRGLADRISEQPPAIKLRFPHKTTDQDQGVDAYYLQSKENRCVACGQTKHYLRYRVVPACYRRSFPVHMKSHRSHDIVLLCVDCHHVAQR
jgi:cobalt/nickel-transporting P-type ATPase D